MAFWNPSFPALQVSCFVRAAAEEINILILDLLVMACATGSQRNQLDITLLLSALETSQKNPVIVPVLRFSCSGVLLWFSYVISVIILC